MPKNAKQPPSGTDLSGTMFDPNQPLKRGWDETMFRHPEYGDFKPKVIDATPVRLGTVADVTVDVPARFEIIPRGSRPILEVEVARGIPVCIALRRQGDGALSSTNVRQPIKEIIDAAVYMLALEPTDRVYEGETVWQALRGRVTQAEFKVGIARQQGVRLPDEFFKKVARVYRDASKAGDDPTAAVATQMHGSKSSAGRWVMQARARGHLGPALPGRPGERRER